MKIAHEQASLKLEVPRGDAAAFRDYAEKLRTHFFDFTRLGQTNPACLIEQIARKLTLNDRLSWNAGRGHGQLETRTLKQFGDWLSAGVRLPECLYNGLGRGQGWR